MPPQKRTSLDAKSLALRIVQILEIPVIESMRLAAIVSEIERRDQMLAIANTAVGGTD